jgi:hypothetical protein
LNAGDRPSVFQRLLDWLTGVDSPLSSRWLTLTMSYKDEDDSQCLSQTYEIDINRESTPLCIPDAQLSMWLVALPMNIPSERRISTISLKTRDDNQHSNGNHSLTRVEVAVIRAHPRGGTDHFRVVRQFAEIPDDNFRSEHDLFVNQTILQRRQEGDQLVMWWTGAECWVDPPLPPDFPGQVRHRHRLICAGQFICIAWFCSVGAAMAPGSTVRKLDKLVLMQMITRGLDASSAAADGRS